MVGLTKFESEMEKYLERVVLLAPCFGYASTIENNMYEGEFERAGYIMDQLNSIGIYATNTSSWSDDRDKICAELDEDICIWAEWQEDEDGSNPLKNEDHWKQTEEAKRFQEYVEDWENPGKTEGTIYKLDNIKRLPVSMFVAENDKICDAPVAFKESQKIKTLQNYYLFKGPDHGLVTNNRPDFFDLLRKEVTTEVSDIQHRQELQLLSFTDEDFWYTWDKDAWKEYADEYCNGDENQEGCLDGFMECSSATPPAEACFYEDAYYYRDGSTCVRSWRTWDNYCRSDCKDEVRCAEIEANYATAVENGGSSTDPDVFIPGVSCFYATAWDYSDESTCAYTWRDFDKYCEGSSRDQAICDTVYKDYKNCIGGDECISTLTGCTFGGVCPPDPATCYTSDAYYYTSGDDCAMAWRYWDAFCSGEEPTAA